MKKKFCILTISCLSILSCSKSTIHSDKKNDVFNYGFNGKIKSVKSEVFDLIAEKDTYRIGDKINGISIDRNLLLEFNKLGNLTSSKEFLANGKVSDETIYTYDKNNRLVKKKEFDNYGKGSFIDYEFDYNSKDSLTKMIMSNNDFKRIHKIERDENNRAIKNDVSQNDTIFKTYKVKYDLNDNIISENEFEYNDIPVKLIERTFNKHNLKVKEQVVEFKTWDTLNYENRFFYDTNQKLILGKYNIQSDSIFSEVKNQYNKNGKLKESITTFKGSEFSLIEIQKFNEQGDLIDKSVKTSDNKTNDVWNYNFKYDSKNNWIEKTEFKNKEPLIKVNRTIEYYE